MSKSVHNGLDVMQGRHLKGGGWKSLQIPRIYDFSIFPVNRTFETVLLLQKQYVTQS